MAVEVLMGLWVPEERTYPSSLARSVLNREQLIRCGPRQKLSDQGKVMGAGEHRDARLVIGELWRRVVRGSAGHVAGRKIRDNQVEAAGWEPACDRERHIQVQALRVRSSHVDRVGRDVGSGYGEFWALVLDCKRKRTTSRPDIVHPPARF
jgi:hypothetical protein